MADFQEGLLICPTVCAMFLTVPFDIYSFDYKRLVLNHEYIQPFHVSMQSISLGQQNLRKD